LDSLLRPGAMTTDRESPPPVIGAPLDTTVLYLAPVAVGFLLPLVSLPIITNAVGVDDYGAWAVTTALATLVTSACGLGLPVVFERDFFEAQDTRKQAALLYSILAFVTVTYLVVGVAAAAWSRPLAQWLTGSASYGPVVTASYAATAVVAIKSYYLLYFRNTLAPREFVRYSIDENVTGVALTIVLVAVFGMGALGLALGPLLASSWVLTMVVARTWRRVPPAFDGELLGRSLRLAVPLTPRIFMKAIAGNFDKYLVAQLASLGGAGIYAVGQRLALAVFTAMTAFENSFAPTVYSQMFRGGADAGAALARYLTPFIYFSVAIAMIVVTFATEIVTVLAAPSYRQAAPIAAVLAFYYASLFFGKLPQLLYAKRVSLMLSVSAASVALNIGLCAWFAARWGAPGAAAGTALGGVLATALYMFFGQRAFRIAWSYSRLAAIYGCLALAVAIGWLIEFTEVAYVPGLIVRVGVLAMFAWLGAQFDILSGDSLRSAAAVVRARLRGAHAGR
jgi:O-antigen/teichoic acid export membrane protein